MRRLIGLVISGLAVSGLLTAQTLNVQVGKVTYQFPAAQTGEMPYSNGTSLTVMGKVFALSEIDNMYIDETAVTDGSVAVAYSGSSADITVAGNIAKDLTIAYKNAHVSIVQSADMESEVTYTLSGSSSDGGFYNEGSYKATVELNNLTLTNVSATYSGAAIHIQNSKRIKVKPLNGTTNTLVDAANGSQKGCLYIKGHAEFAQKGTLNITGNVKHGIKTGEYFTIKNSTINILSAAGDGINCEQFFLMESGTISIKNVADDGLQCDLEDPDTGSTGITTDHEDEDSGNVYISGGTFSAAITADACKGLKSEGDMYISGGTIIAVGNLEGGAQISGGTCKYTTSWTANAWYALYNGGTLVAAFQTPSKTTSSGGGFGPGGGGSSQKLVVYTSSTPTLKSGVTVSEGTEYFSGLANIGGTVSGGTSVTLSNYSSGGGFGW